MQESVEAVSEFVVAGREVTKLFEPVEESLNQIGRFVPLPIELARGESVAARRDDGLRLSYCRQEQKLKYVNSRGHMSCKLLKYPIDNLRDVNYICSALGRKLFVFPGAFFNGELWCLKSNPHYSTLI